MPGWSAKPIWITPRGELGRIWQALSALEEVIVLSGCRRGGTGVLDTAGAIPGSGEGGQGLQGLWGENFYIELQDNLLPGNQFLNRSRLELARSLGIRPVATNNVHYASRQDFVLHDILTCIRTLSRVEDIHSCPAAKRGRAISNPLRRWKGCLAFVPEAIESTMRIAEMCEEGLDLGKTHFPVFP